MKGTIYQFTFSTRALLHLDILSKELEVYKFSPLMMTDSGNCNQTE